MSFWGWIAVIWGASLVTVVVLYWQTLRREKARKP